MVLTIHLPRILHGGQYTVQGTVLSEELLT